MADTRGERVRRLVRTPLSWPSVRWALAEFALVFAGVLLALWVENWSQRRDEAELRDRYIAALVADLDADIAAIQEAVGSNADRISAPLGRAVEALVEGDLPDADTLGFIRDVQMGVYMVIPHVRDGTFRDLQSSGYLRLIDDMETRRLLFDYYSRWTWLDRYQDAMLAAKVQRISPMLANVIPPRLFTHTYDVTDRLPPERRTLDVDAALRDQSLESAVFFAWGIARWQEGHFQDMLGRARTLRDHLAADAP